MPEEERIEKLLETFAEGIIYIMLTEKVKNSMTDSCNSDEKE